MSRDNVKRVIVTSGNQGVLGAGSRAQNLALGQIGVFDANTNVSIDATSTPRNFYLAVGIDSDGDGVVDSIKKSSGQDIQSDHLRDYTFRPHTAAQPMKVNINFSNIEAGKSYGIKVEMRNLRVMRIQGTNQFTETYAVIAANDSETDFAVQLRDQINANEDGGFVRAVLVTNQALTVVGGYSKEYAAGDEITDEADLAAIKANEANVSVSVQLISKPLAVNKAMNLNLAYYNLAETVIIPSLVDGFTSADNTVIVQEARYEEGNIGQIRQLEYHENGLASPYVLSDTTGTARELTYHATSGKFDQINLVYGGFSQSGWKNYLADLQTTIAVPTTDGTTRAALMTILDAQFTPKGFDALADDAALAVADPAVVEPTEDKAANTDGVA